MSRIGNKPVSIPKGVTIEVKQPQIQIKGPKGQLTLQCPAMIKAVVQNESVVFSRADEQRHTRELHGLIRSLLASMVKGVTEGYSKRLLIFGTGYSCAVQSKKLQLNVGFMGRSVNKGPQFEIPIPEGIDVKVEVPAARGESEPAKLLISGIDKQKVGQFASEIRSIRKPEPYKGKGVRYEDERVIRKQGKALTSGG